jgi:hypothetical protein
MGAVNVRYPRCSCSRPRKTHEKNVTGMERKYDRPITLRICADLQVEEDCIRPFDFLGGDRGSHQEKTRLHPTPTGPGRCPAAPICVLSIAITYYEVNLPVMTCSQHTQYFL